MIREFDSDNNQMIEYDENEDSLELIKRIPIYIGGFFMCYYPFLFYIFISIE